MTATSTLASGRRPEPSPRSFAPSATHPSPPPAVTDPLSRPSYWTNEMVTSDSTGRPSDRYLVTCLADPLRWSEMAYYEAVAQDVGWTLDDLTLALRTPDTRLLLVATRPLLWALVHCRDSLVLQDGPHAGEVTMGTLSLDFFINLYSWTRPCEYPGQIREIMSGPRESAKSTNLAKIGPAFLLCTSNRPEFAIIVTYLHSKAKERMAGVRSILSSPTILEDYPHVAAPPRGSFRESDTMFKFKMANGSVLMTTGIKTGGLSGELEGNLRPSLIVLDDISPGGDNWSPNVDEGTLDTIRSVIYKLGAYQRMWWVGTTTAYGSLVHQAIVATRLNDASSWVTKDGWRVRHHLPLPVKQSPDGALVETSYWPAKYSTEYIISQRALDDRLFSIDWANDPLSAADGTWFTREMFVRETLPTTSIRVVSVDPGVSKTGDPCGFSVVAFSLAVKKAAVDEAFELPARSTDIKRAVLHLLDKYRDTSYLVWESTNGGSEYAYSVLGEDFERTTGVKLVFHSPRTDKIMRAEVLLGRYKLGQVLHPVHHRAFEDELLLLPHFNRSPNMTDSVGQALKFIAEKPMGSALPKSFNYEKRA